MHIKAKKVLSFNFCRIWYLEIWYSLEVKQCTSWKETKWNKSSENRVLMTINNCETWLQLMFSTLNCSRISKERIIFFSVNIFSSKTSMKRENIYQTLHYVRKPKPIFIIISLSRKWAEVFSFVNSGGGLPHPTAARQLPRIPAFSPQ